MIRNPLGHGEDGKQLDARAAPLDPGLRAGESKRLVKILLVWMGERIGDVTRGGEGDRLTGLRGREDERGERVRVRGGDTLLRGGERVVYRGGERARTGDRGR